MKVVVAVNVLEGCGCAIQAAGALVAYTPLVAGEVVGPVVAIGGYSAVFAG